MDTAAFDFGCFNKRLASRRSHTVNDKQPVQKSAYHPDFKLEYLMFDTKRDVDQWSAWTGNVQYRF